MPHFFTVGDLARLVGAPPRAISDAFYARQLNDELCPVIGGRRLIPREYVSEVRRVLRERGKLQTAGA